MNSAEGEKMRRLYRSRRNRVIAGVCGGVAEYLNVDPVLVRLIAVLFLFVGGGSLIAYILGIIIIPEEPRTVSNASGTSQEQNVAPPENAVKPGQAGGLVVGLILIAIGMIFLLRHIPFFNQFYWWFWDMGWHFLWPSLLILLGLLLIFKATRNGRNLH